jgi:uncharacterized protein (TIGR02246 family)
MQLLGAALFALVAVAPAFAADKDLEALAAADQAFVKAFNEGNATAIAALYDENAVLLPPNAPAQSGRKAIQDYLQKEMDGAKKGGVKFNLGANPVGGHSGKMGWQSGSYTVTDKAGKVVEAGKYLSVSMKKDGKWLYVRDTWNADAPAPKK